MSNSGSSKDQPNHSGMLPAERQRLREMMEDEVPAAALSDPGAQPLNPAQLAAARRSAFARLVGRKLGMGRESFANAYGIPLETLVAWERHEAQASLAELAYLRLIERAPDLARIDLAKAV